MHCSPGISTWPHSRGEDVKKGQVHRAAWFTPNWLLPNSQFTRIRVVCKPRCQTSCPRDSQLIHPQDWKQEECTQGSLTPPLSPPQRQEFLGWADGPPPPPPSPSLSGLDGENRRGFPVSQRGAQSVCQQWLQGRRIEPRAQE